MEPELTSSFASFSPASSPSIASFRSFARRIAASVCLVAATVGVAAFGSGCTFAMSDAEGEADDAEPVEARPLEGTVRGATFTARSALRHGTVVDVYDVDATCDDEPARGAAETAILLSVPDWRAGTAFQLDFYGGRSVTFVRPPGKNYVVSSGRVEVVDPGSLATPGVLRLRVGDDTNGRVEGEIAVVNCGG